MPAKKIEKSAEPQELRETEGNAGTPSEAVRKASRKRRTASSSRTPSPTPEKPVVKVPAASESDSAVVQIVHEEIPEIVSMTHPEKRTANYKEPTPLEKWRPEWRPRKRMPGTRGTRANDAAIAAVEEKLLSLCSIGDLPRDGEGRVYPCDELVDAACAYVSSGGVLSRFAAAVGVHRFVMLDWLMSEPAWKAKYFKAKDLQVDAMAEDAVTIATEPVMVEDVYESYDADGNLIRRDVKRSDATYARKLAVQTRTEIIKKWAPEKYGEKVEVKTDSSMAAKILAARRRLSGGKGD